MIVGLNTAAVTYICLNAFAKLQNTRVESRQPVLMGNCPTCLYVLPYQSTEWFVISPFQVVHGMRFCGHERVASLEDS